MINKDLQQSITYLAQTSFIEKVKPEHFAFKAAILVASDAARKHNAESVSDAILVASLSATNLLSLSSELAFINAQDKNGRLNSVFAGFKDEIKTLDFESRAITQFHAAYAGSESEQHQKSLQAAQSTFLVAFTSSYDAYKYGIESSARAVSGTDFKTAFSKQFEKNISSQPIEPSFLMKLFTSKELLYVSALALAGGVLAMAIGVGLMVLPYALPALGITMTATYGAACAATAIAGGAVAVGSATVMSARFFAQKTTNYENQKSSQAFEAFCNA